MFYVLAAILGGTFGIAWAAVTGDRSIPRRRARRAHARKATS